MRSIAKILFVAACAASFFGIKIALAKEGTDSFNKKNNSVVNKITQKGFESVEISEIDRSKLSTKIFGFKNFVDKKEVSETEKKTLTANEKRLAHYKPRLDAYNPPEDEISILVTGYSSTPDQTWGDPFITASGTRVHLGTMACPVQYPFGTKISIEGQGTYICEDRGGAIKGSHFDMWFESRGEALHWGKRVLVAKIEK